MSFAHSVNVMRQLCRALFHFVNGIGRVLLMMPWNRAPRIPTETRELISDRVESVLVEDRLLRESAAGAPVSERFAMQVHAFAAASQLVTHQAASLPLVSWANNVREIPQVLEQPELGVPRWVTLQRTYQDLALHGVAWWQVTRTDWDGYPVRVQWLPATSVRAGEGHVTVEGRDIPMSRMVRFDGFAAGKLVTGAKDIRTAHALHTLAERRAHMPQPSVFFTPKADAPDPSDDEIDDMKEDWAANPLAQFRYLGASVDMKQIQWNSVELQLVEAVGQADAAMARLWNVDPAWLGLGVAGSSLTYQNRQDLRAQLVDGPVRMLVSAVEQRLSMSVLDIDTGTQGAGFTAARTRRVRADFSGYLRPDLPARVAVAQQALDAGIWDETEAKGYVNEFFD
jgi:hypothetical protein